MKQEKNTYVLKNVLECWQTLSSRLEQLFSSWFHTYFDEKGISSSQKVFPGISNGNLLTSMNGAVERYQAAWDRINGQFIMLVPNNDMFKDNDIDDSVSFHEFGAWDLKWLKQYDHGNMPLQNQVHHEQHLVKLIIITSNTINICVDIQVSSIHEFILIDKNKSNMIGAVVLWMKFMNVIVNDRCTSICNMESMILLLDKMEYRSENSSLDMAINTTLLFSTMSVILHLLTDIVVNIK